MDARVGTAPGYVAYPPVSTLVVASVVPSQSFHVTSVVEWSTYWTSQA